jgi:hypothetical protein
MTTNDHIPLFNTIVLGAPTPVIAASPTPDPSNHPTATEPPTGWVFAGILVILLIMMMYQSIKRFVLKLLKKNQPINSKKR